MGILLNTQSKRTKNFDLKVDLFCESRKNAETSWNI